MSLELDKVYTNFLNNQVCIKTVATTDTDTTLALRTPRYYGHPDDTDSS